MDILQRVKDTPQCDWPVADKELAGPKHFFSLYGSEHIAATEFVIGATLVQYGVSAMDILLGLAIGNMLATLSFALLCAPIAVDTRLSLYSYLQRVVGSKVQKLYNLVFGIGFAALGATGICISASAIRRILDVPIQQEWYPTSLKFIFIVLILGSVIIFIAANGFRGVTKFAAACVPWMITLFFLGFVGVLPQLSQITGITINSPTDLFNMLNNYVWVAQSNTVDGEKLSLIHIIAFAWTINVPLHLGLNDMSVLRYAKSKNYGYISCVGMFVGHYFAWISAGIMGATTAILLNMNLATLDAGEVSFTVLGYAGLIGVIIAGWTTANPTIYRVALSFNEIFPSFTYKKLTYILGTIVTIAACFPGVQSAADVLTYLGLLVVGMGAVCIAEYFIFPKIGYTRYWNLYRKSNLNQAALIAWGLSLVFFILMLIFKPIHQNFWFIPTFLIALFSYIFFAGKMGAKEKYTLQEQDELVYQQTLRQYVNEQVTREQDIQPPPKAKIISYIGYIALILMVIGGGLLWNGVLSVETFKTLIFSLSLIYFVVSLIVTIITEKIRKDEK